MVPETDLLIVRQTPGADDYVVHWDVAHGGDVRVEVLHRPSSRYSDDGTARTLLGVGAVLV